MNNYFNDSHEWTEKDINFIGLPRPFKNFDKKYFKKIASKVNISNKFPVPWQSRPVFNNPEDSVVFNVIQENESLVIKNSLCSYCGIKIKNNDECVRWEASDLVKASDKGPRIKSDYHPLHLECMKQARIFCPFMRNVNEKEFFYGSFKKLKKDSEYFINIKANVENY